MLPGLTARLKGKLKWTRPQSPQYGVFIVMNASALALILFVAATSCAPLCHRPISDNRSVDLRQVPTWSPDDLEFFTHGSLGTEVIPEEVLRAFRATYPELFPDADFAAYGAIPDRDGLPIGFSRRDVPHLGKMSAIGINCAACHVGEIQSPDGSRVRVLGMTAQFNVEMFFGAVIVATFQTANPANMEKFLAHYLHMDSSAIAGQHAQIVRAIQEDPTGATGAGPGGLQAIAPSDLHGDSGDLSPTVRALLKLFHNMRAALHVPDQPPTDATVLNGPGRNDPWRILSFALLGIVTKPGPVKFGIVWNEDQRDWVHVDGNTHSPIVRNLAAALGLGAPLIGHTGVLDFAVVQRQTALSQVIRPPPYPWVIDRTAAKRGATMYTVNCAGCHDGPATDRRLHDLAEIGTDSNRADIFTQRSAELFNQFFAELQISGYKPPRQPLRGTQKYWSPDLAGAWARAPYLHNGSVRTMQELLAPPAAREKQWHRGTRLYDPDAMGYASDGTYAFDASLTGNSNGGHDYGTQLTAAEKRDLIEYLKTK